ncbi:hypothetical protein HZY62_10160, partial [Maribacter polysiphoniae]
DGTDDQDLGIGTNGVANQSVEVTITDGAAALIDIRDGDSSDTNEIQDLDLTSDILKVTNNGSATEIDLSGYTNTDNQIVDGLTFNAGTGELAISLEDDGAAPVTVNLSALDTDTDDQQVDTFSFNSTTGELTLEVQDDGQPAHVANLSALDTNTTNTSLTQDGTNLVLTDSDTNSVTIPLADLGTDNQTVDGLTFNAGTGELAISLEDDGAAPVTVNLSALDTDTDNQIVDGLTFNAGTGELAISLEDDGAAPVTVNLSALDTDTDDQQVDTFSFNSTTGELTLEVQDDGQPAHVANLSALDTNTTNTSLTQDGTNLVLTDSDTNSVTIPLADLGTDNQTVDGLTFNAGTGELAISLEDDGAAPVTVNLSALDTDTDNQIVDGLTFNAGTGELAISLEDDGAAPVTVNLSALDTDTDDQQVDTFSFNSTTGELTLEVQDDGQPAHVANLSALDTNTTNTSLTQDGTNLVLTDSDTNSVTIPLADLGTDNQVVDGLTFNAGTGELAISLEDDGAAPVTVNLSALDTDTDDQQVDTFSFNSTTGELTLEVQDDGQPAHVANLSALNTNTTNTSLTQDGTNLVLTDSDTNSVTIPLADLGTDDQNSDEVNNVASSIDLNGDLTVDAADIIDVDGDGVVDSTVQDVIEAITPITSKAARIFYPPSIAVDASSVVVGATIDLYKQYVDQYGMTLPSSAKSTSAPAKIPTYTRAELYYYVTYYDPTVFSNVTISDTGVMTYNVDAPPADYNSLINVVFVVK